MTTTSADLRRTAFYDYHVDHDAKMVDFAGWDMPLHYGSIIEEHKQVRTSGGLFDVSHMGRLRFTGKDACRFLDYVCTRQIHGMSDGQVRYGLICNENGGCRDDVLVYKLKDGEYLMVCNASNRLKLLDHFDDVRGDMKFKLKDETESTVMVAIQGPRVMELIGSVSKEIPALKRYRCTEKNLIIAKILVSRTGYTGEDGVEAILPAKFAAKAVDMLVSKAAADDPDAIKPCGLGARDSLRLEAGMALYGHEITEELDPVSAGLMFAIKINKGADDENVPRFIGQDVLEKIAADGPKRKLIGLVLDGRRAARQDMKVYHNDKEVGVITSGCLSPTLGKSIAMAYLDTELAESKPQVQIDLGRQRIDATVQELPFYKSGS